MEGDFLGSPLLNALHTSLPGTVNTALRGSDSCYNPFCGVHLGSEKARSLPRRNSWDIAEMRFELCGHREHSHEGVESLPGEATL